MRRILLLIMFAVAMAPSPVLCATAEGIAPAAVENLDAAYTAWRSHDYEALEPLIKPLVAENPYSGRFRYALGDAGYNLKKYAEGAEAYMAAAALGFHAGAAYYNAGCCYALMGETDKAIDAVEKAIGAGMQNREQLLREDSDLDSIRDTDAFRERILPVVPDGVSRVEGWRIDLAYLDRRMRETHYDLFCNISEEAWADALDAIRSNIDSTSDDDIIVDLMQLFVEIGDGHTCVFPPVADGTWHALPLDFYVFSDGVFVRKADGRYADVVGKRVVSLGGVPVDEVLEWCASVTQRDNTQQIKWLAPLHMTVTETLKHLGVIDDVGHVDLVVADAAGKESAVRVESVPLDHEIFNRRFDNVVTMRDHAPGPRPLWATYADQDTVHYAFQYLPDDDLVYFYFDSVRDADHGESLAEFSRRMHAFMREKGVGTLVIDVRLNHGGNNFLAKPVFYDLIRDDALSDFGSLYVIIGRETFSACQNFVNWIDRDLHPVFVGEPTGSKPNFVGEHNLIVLPYSGLRVSGSSRYWQDSLSEDTRPWIAPHLVAEVSSSDYAANRDPSMDAIRAYLKHRRASGDTMGAR